MFSIVLPMAEWGQDSRCPHLEEDEEFQEKCGCEACLCDECKEDGPCSSVKT